MFLGFEMFSSILFHLFFVLFFSSFCHFDSEDMYTALKMIADFKRSCNGKAKPMPPEIVPWSW